MDIAASSLQLRLVLHSAQRLAHLDLVPGPRHKLEALRCLEYHDNGAAEHEAAHLLAGRERLAMQDRRGLGVDGFRERLRRMLRMSFVGAKILGDDH